MGWAQLRVGKFIGTLSAYRNLSEMESQATGNYDAAWQRGFVLARKMGE
jgi:hypothetical protein